MPDDARYIDLKEFREFGFLQEVNRLFFHPLGMALTISVDDNGIVDLAGIQDYREDPEGFLFGDFILNGVARLKAQRVKEFMDKKHAERLKALGFVVQPLT